MKTFNLVTLIFIGVLSFTGCDSPSDSVSESESSTTTDSDATTESTTSIAIDDWTEATHTKNVDPNFDEVFDDTEVKRLDIVISSENWQSMLDNMTELYGTFGATSNTQTNNGAQIPGAVPGGGGGAPIGAQASLESSDLTTTEARALTTTDEDPIFVPSEVYYNGIQWYKVGVRFKGNSSLQSAWENGILKLSLKLDFDEYEDTYPEIDNQRFYGFKKFSLKNNYDDHSLLREKVAADVFKDAGLVVSHTAFYTLYVDHGDGPEYFGLYTLVEEVDGSVLDTQFSSDDGNLYKPEDGSANFVEGTFNSEDFVKKTNEDEADFSDIEALFAALHDESRTTDAPTWRTNLEAVFDVDTFLKYLAVNGVIQNWDTYGVMIHNYYLYNNPDNGKLTWIPWDNNEALQDGKMGGALALDFSNLSSTSWPLIANIYADATYKAQYDAYVQETIDSAFNSTNMQSTYDGYAAMVETYAVSERDGYSFLETSNIDTDFTDAIDTLKIHAVNRTIAAESYLGQ